MKPLMPSDRVRRLAGLSALVASAIVPGAAALVQGDDAADQVPGPAPTASTEADQDSPTLRRDPPDVLEEGQACTDCHLDLTRGVVVHSPVEEGECEDCHQPLSPTRHAFAAIPSTGRLCGLCHETPADAPVLHGPVALGSCEACHDPHRSDHPGLLRRRVPDMCLSCHEDMAALLRAPAEIHAELDASCTRCHAEPVLVPAGPQAVHGALSTNRACLNCHEPHGSALPPLLHAPTAKLCLTCHEKELRREDGTTVAAMGAKLRDSAALHGPLREGKCTACHDPHASSNALRLRAPYPRSFYAAFSVQRYALCFRCHDATPFVERDSADATDFRDGRRNLHALHVSNPDMGGKGRTCRACHEIHASDLPHHIRKSVPFGAWQLPLGFRDLPDGGSCAPGCHTPQSYAR